MEVNVEAVEAVNVEAVDRIELFFHRNIDTVQLYLKRKIQEITEELARLHIEQKQLHDSSDKKPIERVRERRLVQVIKRMEMRLVLFKKYAKPTGKVVSEGWQPTDDEFRSNTFSNHAGAINQSPLNIVPSSNAAKRLAFNDLSVDANGCVTFKCPIKVPMVPGMNGRPVVAMTPVVSLHGNGKIFRIGWLPRFACCAGAGVEIGVYRGGHSTAVCQKAMLTTWTQVLKWFDDEYEKGRIPWKKPLSDNLSTKWGTRKIPIWAIRSVPKRAKRKRTAVDKDGNTLEQWVSSGTPRVKRTKIDFGLVEKCSLCLEDFGESALAQSMYPNDRRCGHKFCCRCIVTHIRSKLQDPRSLELGLPCLHVSTCSCSGIIRWREILRLHTPKNEKSLLDMFNKVKVQNVQKTEPRTLQLEMNMRTALFGTLEEVKQAQLDAVLAAVAPKMARDAATAIAGYQPPRGDSKMVYVPLPRCPIRQLENGTYYGGHWFSDHMGCNAITCTMCPKVVVEGCKICCIVVNGVRTRHKFYVECDGQDHDLAANDYAYLKSQAGDGSRIGAHVLSAIKRTKKRTPNAHVSLQCAPGFHRWERHVSFCFMCNKPFDNPRDWSMHSSHMVHCPMMPMVAAGMDRLFFSNHSGDSSQSQMDRMRTRQTWLRVMQIMPATLDDGNKRWIIRKLRDYGVMRVREDTDKDAPHTVLVSFVMQVTDQVTAQHLLACTDEAVKFTSNGTVLGSGVIYRHPTRENESIKFIGGKTAALQAATGVRLRGTICVQLLDGHIDSTCKVYTLTVCNIVLSSGDAGVIVNPDPDTNQRWTVVPEFGERVANFDEYIRYD